MSHILVFWHEENANWSVQSIGTITSPRKEYEDYGVEFVMAKFKGSNYPGLIVEKSDDKKKLTCTGVNVCELLEKHGTLRAALKGAGIDADHLDERADKNVHFKENQVSNKENQVSNKENPVSKKVTAESKKIEREKTKKEKEAKKEEELKKKAAREEEKATALAANRVYLQQLENFALESQNTYLDMDTVTDHEQNFDCDIIEEIIDIPHERPTVAMKCPRGNHAKSVCTNCIALREELQECREELQQLQTMLQSRHAVNTNTDDEPKPRPGIVVSEIAQRHNMVELVPQSGVYLYPKHLREADRKENGKKRCRFLLSCFYTSAELIHAGNLTGANSKPGCNIDIIDAIIGYCLLSDKITTAADLRTAMRSKITAHCCEQRRKSLGKRRSKTN